MTGISPAIYLAFTINNAKYFLFRIGACERMPKAHTKTYVTEVFANNKPIMGKKDEHLLGVVYSPSLPQNTNFYLPGIFEFTFDLLTDLSCQ